MLSFLAFWSNYIRSEQIGLKLHHLFAAAPPSTLILFLFLQNQLPLILLNHILDKQFPLGSHVLYDRLSFLLSRIALWHIGPNVVRLNQLKQGQNKRLHCLVLAAKVSISAAVFIILRHLATIVLLLHLQNTSF
jgi:hypothetical protein